MKLSLPRSTLTAAVQVIGRAVSTRSTLPSLGGILITAEGATTTLRATDMELALALEVDDARIESEGVVLLPGRLLMDVARSLPETTVTLQFRSDHRDVEITAGGAHFHLRTLAAEEFPRLPAFEGESLQLPAAALAEGVQRVARAASRDEVRPILTGVLVTAEESTLTMVATDSYRLSVKHTKLETPVVNRFEANVPARALRELARIIAQEEPTDVAIAMSRNQALFKVGRVLLSSRLIEGQFPSWRQLIPESFEHEVHLPREEFGEVTRRVSQVAQRNAPLRLAFSEGELTVATETPDVGDASEGLPVAYSGEPLEIAFNPQFLIEGVDSVAGEKVALSLSSPLRPGLLRSVEGEDFSYLVMPIRLNV